MLTSRSGRHGALAPMSSQRRRRVARERGERVATILAGAWRRLPPPLDLSLEALDDVVPLLLATGGAGLAWWRVRDSPLGACPAALPLRQAYRMQRFHAAVHERRIARTLTMLRAAGVEPLLVKGWAAALLYPEPGLRPYGDIDLLIEPDQFDTSRAALAGLGMDPGDTYPVDLHREARDLDRAWHHLYARSRSVRIGDAEAQTLGFEDQLRLLCVHAFREAVWRPLWLCDIAAALEALPVDFDWDRCLSGTARSAEWITCAALLANRALGARLDGVPPASRTRRLPRWLLPAVFRQWGTREYYMHTTPVALTLGSPARAFGVLRLRWPSPFRATVSMGGSFNNLPRLPYQLAECVSRAVRFAAQLVWEPRRSTG
ncbi:MAG: nucleotidyltransferase family protein [Gemmatimonadetes bacterium]|nr:nucleotidyltransferase family protein [Gemmatimonadota bacterium]